MGGLAGGGGLNFGGVKIGAGAVAYAGKFPPALAFVMPLGAALLATVFDFIFETLHLGGWLWWAVTALCFAGAGFGAGLTTKAAKPMAIVGIVVGAIVYAILTMFLTAFIFGSRSNAAGAAVGFLVGIIPASINFGIGVATGISGVIQGNKQRTAAGVNLP